MQEEPFAVASVNLLDVVAQCVAAILPTVQTDTFVKSIFVAAPVGNALLVFVQQRVNE